MSKISRKYRGDIAKNVIAWQLGSKNQLIDKTLLFVGSYYQHGLQLKNTVNRDYSTY